MSLARTPTSNRREARRQTRREAIVQVAAKSFLELGYMGTTMTAIASQLGGSKGTLWGYFASKDLLFAAVIDHVTDAFREQLILILNPQDDVETVLDRFCEQYMRKVTSPDAISLQRLVIGEAGRFPEVGRIFYERAPQATQHMLAQYLEAAMSAGLLREDDPLNAARLLIGRCMLGAHQQLLMRAIFQADSQRIRADVDGALKGFMAAYSVKQRASDAAC